MPDRSGDIRDRMIGERDSGIGRPRRVARGLFGLFRYGVPPVQVVQNFPDDGSLVDDGNDAHGVAAFGAFERVNAGK